MKSNESQILKVDYECEEESQFWSSIFFRIYFVAMIFSPFITIISIAIGAALLFISPHQFAFSAPKWWSLLFWVLAVVFGIIWFRNRKFIRWDQGGPE